MSSEDKQASGSAAGEPLWHLLYRYLWPFQYFRDVTRGSKLERQQNYRYNRSMRACLPGFMLKWLLLTALCFAAGAALAGVEAILPAAACYILGSWAFIVAVVLGVDWVWLERFPELY